jgi:hypothetical protein
MFSEAPSGRDDAELEPRRSGPDEVRPGDRPGRAFKRVQDQVREAAQETTADRMEDLKAGRMPAAGPHEAKLRSRSTTPAVRPPRRPE